MKLIHVLRTAPLFIALCCMTYLSYQLIRYLQIDPLGYLPSVGYWCMGLFFALCVWLARTQAAPLFILLNTLYLTGLVGLVLIF